ncbi:hypothetical protein AB1N83_000681 [Pleurotus pulmonarius]
MKGRYFSPRRTSASHQPCPTERMVNPWFHPYPCSKRRRSRMDPWMDGFLQESAIRRGGEDAEDEEEDEDEIYDQSDVQKDKGIIYLLVVENLNISVEPILMSGRKV